MNEILKMWCNVSFLVHDKICNFDSSYMKNSTRELSFTKKYE